MTIDISDIQVSSVEHNDNYMKLNAELNLFGPNGEIQYDKDRQAVRAYFRNHVNPNYVHFNSLKDKIEYLVSNEYYEKEFLDLYTFDQIKEIFKQVYNKKFRFPSFVSALKFYSSYSLKTFDGKRYLELYDDRVAVCALYFANGDYEYAQNLAEEMITGRFQPATPSFLNAGKKQRGEGVSCFLLSVEDDLHSIGRVINSALQLSKRGGGVAINLSNIRAHGDPIKKVQNQSSGVIPIMKMLEDSFSYANQLGARQGAGAVYLSAHHLDIMRFLDTKRENADEKIRIKTLSLGVVIPDITIELARRGEPMYLFSPYDMEKVYGKEFSWLNITEIYQEAVDNPNIRKEKIDARRFLNTIAEIQVESGYPYIMFEDAVNRANNVPGKIIMSNLCVTGDSLVLTDNGYKTAAELYNTQEDFKVVVDDRAREFNKKRGTVSLQNSTKMFRTAENAHVYNLTTNEGLSLKATEWHKFYVERDNQIIKIQMNQLIPGDKLLIQPAEGTYGSDDYAEVAFHEAANKAYQANNNEGDTLTETISMTDILYKANKETQLGYVNGLFLKNGEIKIIEGDITLSITAAKSTLASLQVILLNMGVYTYIHETNNGESVLVPADQLQAYNLANMLVLDGDAEYTLSRISAPEDVTEYFATVASVDYVGTEDVYDVTVSNGNTLVFNGISTGNCSEILQPQTPSVLNADQTYDVMGKDISCNLGSLNVRKALQSPDFGKTIEISIRTLTQVSDMSDIDSVPTVKNGNSKAHAVGLGAMNLHGAFAFNQMYYGDEESLDLTNMYFYLVTYHAIRTSMEIAKERGVTFEGFNESKYATGEYFEDFINPKNPNFYLPQTEKVQKIMEPHNLPTTADWAELAANVKEYGMYNQNLQAVPPTGSISYLSNSTSSILPVQVPGGIVETRSEGKLGTVYLASPEVEGNEQYYTNGNDIFSIDQKKIIDIYSVAQRYVDQGLSLTLGYHSDVSTKVIVTNIVYSFSKGKTTPAPGDERANMLAKFPQGNIKTLYYIRVLNQSLEAITDPTCVSCAL